MTTKKKVSPVIPASEPEPEELPEEEITVQALHGGRKVYTIDNAGTRVPIPFPVTYKDYEGAVRVPMLGKHVLGRVSKQFQIVDHATVVQPLKEAGFTDVLLLHHYMGGAQMLAILANPEIRLEDRISWDSALYEGRENKNMFLAVRVFNALHAGIGPRFSVGYYRVICQNGLVARALGLGDVHYTHVTFSPAELRQWLDKRLGDLSGGRKELPQRPSKILDWPLHQLQESLNEDYRYSSLPAFARNAVKNVVWNKWSREGLVEQLELAHSAETISPLDLLNVVTNVANRGPRGEDSRWGIYRGIDQLFSNLMELADIGCFVSGESAFNLPE